MNKLKENSKNQKDEINKLHERVEFFINECAIMKKTGETLAQEQRNNHLKQKEKYEKQIKTQNEALNKIEELNVVLREKDEIIDARNARIRELDQFISNIINSKGWKLLEKIRKIIYKKNNEKK